MATFTQADFSGGITDSPFSSEPNCAEIIENFLINKDKSLETSPGVSIYSEDADRVPTNAPVMKMYELGTGSFVAFSNRRVYLVKPGGISEIMGPSGNLPFNVGNANSIISVSKFNNHLLATNSERAYPIKIWIDDNNTPKVVTAGLPIPASSPVITGSGANNYVYAFVYFYEYRVGTTLFQDYGTPVFITKSAANATSNSIASIPSISNGSDFNYDVSNIKVKIYRTTNNGTTLYYVGQVNNGTATFVDTVLDAALILNESLYTNGGIQGNDLPPRSKVIFEANNTFYYLSPLSGTEPKPFRVVQSVTSDPDSVPASFFTDFKSDAVGGGAIGRNAIVLTQNETVRLDGIIDETGSGLVVPETISNTVGAVSHNGIVATSKGLYFAGNDGFYFTDGYNPPTKLAKKANFSSKLDNIYKGLVSTPDKAMRIQGVYQKLTNRVFWTVAENSIINDKIYVYDESYDAFTTITFNTGISPTSLLVDGEDLIIGDAQGYLFRMSKDFYTYPVVDTSKEVSDWIQSTIIYRWKSVQLGMKESSLNKWFNKINVQGLPETNIAMGILSYSNGEPESKELYPLRLLPSLVWGDPEFTWGDQGFIWNRTATLNQTRRFASGRMRARQRSIEFTNAYTTLQASTESLDSLVTVNATLKTVTLNDPANYSFGLNNEGYDFIIGSRTYKVLSGTEDTLVLQDVENTLVSGSTAWSLKGYGKGQRAHLMNFSLDYVTISDAGTQWRGSATT